MSKSNYQVVIKKSALKDLKNLKRANLLSQFIKVKEQLEEDPYKPNQRFEKLVPYSEGRYSRRINIQHRVVYRINDKDPDKKVVEIYSAWSHYE